VQQINAAEGSGTGILFRDNDEPGLTWAVNRALDLFDDKKLWRKIMRNGMAKDFSWDRQGSLYVEIFRRLANR
jgi:starch synthase